MSTPSTDPPATSRDARVGACLTALTPILSALPSAAILMHADGTVLHANPGWERITGRKVVDGRAAEAFEEADRARLAASVVEVAAGVRAGDSLAVGICGPDGVVRAVRLDLVRVDLGPTVEDAGGPLVAVLLHPEIGDATVCGSAGSAESIELQRAQRYELLGRLSGSVAHDFNNLLTVVLGQAELIRFDLEQQPSRHGLEGIHDSVANLLDAVDRASSMTRRLLNFTRPSPQEKPVDLDVAEALVDFGRILRRLVPERIALRFEVAKDLPRVRIDRSRLEQIVLNLLVNAVDACPDHGAISILARVERGDVSLVVEDDGPGIPVELRERIFEPFFTTKGAGFGVGLATVRDAVVEAGGAILVRAAQPRGARFEISLPAAENGGPADRAADDTGVAICFGEGPRLSILLCEDDEHVRRGLADSLIREGHRVCDTGDPTAALRFVADGALDPDLVITDMVMPRLAGARLVERLRDHKPGLPAVLVSGYADALEPVGSGEGPTVSLLKPISLAALREAMATCLA